MAVASLSVSRSSIVRLCITIKCFQPHPSVFHKGVELQLMLHLYKCFSILEESDSCKETFNSRSSVTKLESLSLSMACGLPYQPTNVRRTSMNESTVSESVLSMCTALAVKHVNMHPFDKASSLFCKHPSEAVNPCKIEGISSHGYAVNSQFCHNLRPNNSFLRRDAHFPNVFRTAPAPFIIQYR